MRRTRNLLCNPSLTIHEIVESSGFSEDNSFYRIILKLIMSILVNKEVADMSREKFKTLTEQMYYILLCLRKERHGTDIMAVVS